MYGREECVYEVLRDGVLFKVFDGRGNALKFVAIASELLPECCFSMRVRVVLTE